MERQCSDSTCRPELQHIWHPASLTWRLRGSTLGTSTCTRRMKMAKLTITRGLPASGKSTWAEAQRLADPTNTRVVTLDDIRAAIGSSFEQGDEPLAQGIRDYTIRKYLEKGYHVISADTNLPERVVGHLRKLAVQAETAEVGIPVEIKDFRDVPLETCLERNNDRHARGDFKVPNEAIVSMYERFIK
ncbi:MAG: hypothetical protein E6Q97_34345 [Desulfurellales bacterium]|nr:MAG: hypothetical protein E6Q97_34345 [Desulfurellales bacterium]